MTTTLRAPFDLTPLQHAMAVNHIAPKIKAILDCPEGSDEEAQAMQRYQDSVNLIGHQLGFEIADEIARVAAKQHNIQLSW